jgi:hypothetical protein
VEGEGREGAENEEEDVLEDDWLEGEEEKVIVVYTVYSGVGGGLLLDPVPSQVDVKKQEKDSETEDRWLGWSLVYGGKRGLCGTDIELIMLSHQSVM